MKLTKFAADGTLCVGCGNDLTNAAWRHCSRGDPWMPKCPLCGMPFIVSAAWVRERGIADLYGLTAEPLGEPPHVATLIVALLLEGRLPEGFLDAERLIELLERMAKLGRGDLRLPSRESIREAFPHVARHGLHMEITPDGRSDFRALMRHERMVVEGALIGDRFVLFPEVLRWSAVLRLATATAFRMAALEARTGDFQSPEAMGRIAYGGQFDGPEFVEAYRKMRSLVAFSSDLVEVEQV